jgi:hypothetical protein
MGRKGMGPVPYWMLGQNWPTPPANHPGAARLDAKKKRGCNFMKPRKKRKKKK